MEYWYDHVHLISPDPEKTAQFYEMAFKAKRVSAGKRPGGGSSVEVNIKGTRLLIMTPRDESQSVEDFPKRRHGLEHFGLQTDNIEAAITDLKAKGVNIVTEIREARPGVKIAFLMAPENVLIELVEKA